MTRLQTTTKSKQIISKFWKSKPTIASSKIEYDAQKKRMQSQMAKEVVDEMQNGRRKRTRVKGTDEEDYQEGSGDIEESSEEEEDFWIGWKKLLKGLQERATLPFLSLEVLTGVGKTLSSSEGCLRFYIVDPLLRNYNKFLQQHGRNVLFYPGEMELNAMIIQLQG
ncbi:hypothetical protein CU097_012885 [Rhizopus azygosporus]|uniref:Uncharacterized protein n=1 Tax=Rhizopus azygosporus TaxID=86630 RepID=A0A367JW61_RHIAZ|nr:hypothetical protein CU097_012885 [Rhizopus azygosporus]